MEINNNRKHALKGQKRIAQGKRSGTLGIEYMINQCAMTFTACPVYKITNILLLAHFLN